jgi:hypothetical protein
MAQEPMLPTIDSMVEKYGMEKLSVVEIQLDYVIQKELPRINEYINTIDSLYKNLIQDAFKEIRELKEQKKMFHHNLMYVEVVEDVINSKQTEWEDKTFNNMLVKLVGKDEVYKVFVQDKNTPSIGNKIKFIFNADENKLSNMKILE